MPGSVPAAVVADSFPADIHYTSSAESREWAVQQNGYRGTEHQATAQVATSWKSWHVACRLTPAQVATLRTFYEAHLTMPFFFTPIGETQRAVQFVGPWSQSVSMGRLEVSFSIVEIA
jgi:phage-related protein